MFKGLIVSCLLMFGALLMAQTTEVKIKVQDEHRLPISEVFLNTENGSHAGVTNKEGVLTLQVPIGLIRLNASHIGYHSLDTIIQVRQSMEILLTLSDVSYWFSELDLISTWIRDRTPMTYNSYDKAYIDRNNQGQDVPYILQWTPSVVATSDAGAGIGYTGISIRGSDPTRINVTINGVPLNDSESQGVFWVNMPDFASSVDNVQIQRGAGSSTNGAGAFGATINLSTKQVNTEPYGSVSTTIGSFNTRRLNVVAGTGLINKKFTFDVRASKIDSDGYIDRASSDLQSLNISAAYLGKKSALKFNIFSGREVTYQAWNGLPYQFASSEGLRTYNISGARSDGSFYDNQVDNYTQTHYQLIHQYTPFEGLYTNFTLHYTRGYGYYEEFRENDRLNRYKIDPIEIGSTVITRSDLIRRRWLDNHFYGGIFSVNYDAPDLKNSVNFGVALNEYRGDHFGEIIWARFAGDSEYRDHYYFNDARKLDFNTFLKYNRILSDVWSLFGDVQYRRINYRYAGDNNAGWVFDGDVSFDFFNPKAGLFYRDKRGNEGYASFATAAREPNRRDFTDTSEGNQPRPEFMYNPEVGYRYKGGYYNIGANLYLMYYKDQLALTGAINDVGAAVRTNIDDSYRAGVELEADIRLGGFFMATAVTLSRNRALEFIEFIDDWDTGGQIEVVHNNTDLAFSPDIIANLEVGYKANQMTAWGIRFAPELSLLNKYVGRQFMDNTSSLDASLDPYTFSDLRLRIPIDLKGKQALEFNFWINNIFDSQFFSNGWVYRFRSAGYSPLADDPYARREGMGQYNLTGLFPQAGRNWLMGLKYSF